MDNPAGSICYLAVGDANTYVPPPKSFRTGTARTKTANIEVEYVDFSDSAKLAFQHAVEIWESQITTDITIHVLARWAPLGNGILGSASAGTFFTNFEGAQKRGVWYPVSLAEKMARKELNETDEPDIVATFNSANADWHFGINSRPGAGKYDLITIVLHEIGHGLGITHAYEVSGTTGGITEGFNLPVAYETFAENEAGKNLVTGFTPPSTELRLLLTSGKLYFDAPLVRAGNDDKRASLYAPSTYSPGSSIAHLDDNTYPIGNINSLMTPFINSSERNLDPGPIVTAILNEIGWTSTLIRHTPLKNKEETATPNEVVCQVLSDFGYDDESVMLSYKAGDDEDVTDVLMTPTANQNEFTATIPIGESMYSYFMSVTANDDRVFVSPGVGYIPGEEPVQRLFSFEVGPDHKKPIINHIPVPFVVNTDTLRIEAIVTDNLDVEEVMMDYKVNGVDQPSIALTVKPGTDSTYYKYLFFAEGQLLDGDKIEYRLRAKDNANTPNEAAIPSASTFYEVEVYGLSPAQDFYRNNFDALSAADFFGNGFSIVTPTGFTNGAIHSVHPYEPGDGKPNNEFNLIYQLKTPILVKERNATITFDEIVLVEPGDQGVAFGSVDFYDYVIVEGSVDGGVTWSPVADGYDSRSQTAWLTAYNGSTSGQNSTAVGTPALYRNRTLDLLTNFTAGDEVALRFRLYSDQLAAGWGWAIDNLVIQVDEMAPLIKHQHVDFVLQSATQLPLKTRITDLSGLGKLLVEFNVNGGTTQQAEFTINNETELYELPLDISELQLSSGDVLQYRIKASDPSDNETLFPTNGFLSAVVISMTSPVDQVVNDFNANGDLVFGNYFSVSQPTGFTNGAMHSVHPYFSGTSIEVRTEFSFVTTSAVRVSATNPYIVYDEIVQTEYANAGVKDYVILEASKDGVTWSQLLEGYTSSSNATWKTLYDASTVPTATHFRNKRFTIIQNGTFKPGDVILIRFRLSSDALKTGWGWAVDNLSIQGPITGLEPELTSAVKIFPNPVGEVIHVRVHSAKGLPVEIQVMNVQGQVVKSKAFTPSSDEDEVEFSAGEWPNGLYIVKIDTGKGSVLQKVIKTR